MYTMKLNNILFQLLLILWYNDSGPVPTPSSGKANDQSWLMGGKSSETLYQRINWRWYPKNSLSSANSIFWDTQQASNTYQSFVYQSQYMSQVDIYHQWLQSDTVFDTVIAWCEMHVELLFCQYLSIQWSNRYQTLQVDVLSDNLITL